MTLTLRRIGNSNGLIIPAKMLKSLSIVENDLIEAVECNGGILLKKIGANVPDTPFSVLDRWYEENGFSENDPIESALNYVDSIKADRVDKECPKW